MSASPSGGLLAPAARRARAEELLAPFRAEYPFEPHFLELAGGVRMHFVDEGPRTRSAVLCLHGNPTWSFHFRRLVLELSGARRVVAPDHVGCGLSDKPARYLYRLATHAANVERLVTELGLTDLTLVLHDWGGAIGMGFARRRPELVRRLVILNTAAFRSRALPRRIAACRVPVLGELAVRGLGAFSRAALVMATAREGGLPPAVRRGYLAPHGSWRTRVATHAFVRDIPMDARHPSWEELVATEEALPRFRDRPALIVWGERDWCFTPAFREEWQRRLPGARVLAVPDAGHWVLEDAPDEACARIAAFLDETEVPAAAGSAP